MTNTETTGNVMTVLFRSWSDAEKAYQELLNRGFTSDQINLVMSDETRSRYSGVKTELGNKAAEGTGVGAAIGGTVGAILGAIAAVGTAITIPGLGLVVAGPIVAALAGAGAGGATGGLIGALVGWGIPEETVKRYESGLKEGGIVLGFNPRTAAEANEVEKIWKDYNGEMIHR